MNVADLLALAADPADAARRACAARTRGYGRRIWIRPAPAHPLPARAAVLRGDVMIDLSPTPGPETPVPMDLSHAPGSEAPVPMDLSPAPGPEAPVSTDLSPAPGPAAPVPTGIFPAPGDAARWPDPRLLAPGDRLLVCVEHDQLADYCAWLLRAAAAAPDWTVTPCCPHPGGLFRLHLIAAARLALPPGVRVEVRHDLHGVRLSQVALQFGADTLAGPIDAGRHLPLAGVPRPSETSQAALCELVRQAGLEPVTRPSAPESAP